MKALQKFSDDYLETCKQMSTEEIAQFLEDFRQTHGGTQTEKLKLISLKVAPSLLNAFKTKCKLEGSRYQTKIKELMTNYVK